METADQAARTTASLLAASLPAVADGLTSAQVAERVAAGRVNVVPVRSSRSVAAILRANVLTWFNGLIGTLFVIELVVAPIQDALFGFVIVFNALIGIVQEWRAKRTLDALAIVGEARPRVRRDGAETPVAAGELVQDDLVLLAAGDKVPVDGVVVEAEALEVDENCSPVRSRSPAPGRCAPSGSARTRTRRGWRRRRSSSPWCARSCATGSTGSCGI
jgi:cation-transporting ATPase E